MFQECKFAHGNAALLNEALVYAKPEELDDSVIRVSYGVSLYASEIKQRLISDLDRNSTTSAATAKNLYSRKYLGHRLAQTGVGKRDSRLRRRLQSSTCRLLAAYK